LGFFTANLAISEYQKKDIKNATKESIERFEKSTKESIERLEKSTKESNEQQRVANKESVAEVKAVIKDSLTVVHERQMRTDDRVNEHSLILGKKGI
jgi:hypothetical protein